MLTVESLRAFGANTDEGLSRCMGNEAFYLRMVRLACADANFDKLLRAAADGDIDAGFEAAHALKGVTANLALTPILTPVSELTELLRARTTADFRAQAERILALRDELRAMDS